MFDEIQTLINGSLEEKLKVIEKLTTQRLAVLLTVDTADDTPSKFNYIIADVSVKRFNRLSNEGMKSYSEEGLSFSFPDSDFDEFKDEITEFKRKKALEDDPLKGVFRFI